jgi:hypothetical protein
MVVHGIDPAAGDLGPGVCLLVLGKLFSHQEIIPLPVANLYGLHLIRCLLILPLEAEALPHSWQLELL